MEKEDIFKQRQDDFIYTKDELLSELLWYNYFFEGEKGSGFCLVCQNGYEPTYIKGNVYHNLFLMSNIHPSAYVDLTWREFYMWYGLCKPDTEFVVVSDKVRSTDEIMEIYCNKDKDQESFENFINFLMERKYNLRRMKGQSVFNYVDTYFGNVAREVQLDDGIDCYHDNNSIKSFLEACWKRISEQKR